MNFPPKLILPFLAATALVIIGGVYLAGGPDAGPAPAPEKTPASAAASSLPSGTVSASSASATAPSTTTAPGISGPLLEEKEQILEAIEDATVTYDPQELPKIQPYLLHADPEVRQAALEGMVNMGDSAAAPLLRSAARLAVTPQETVALTEAADYLELPPASLIGIKTRRPELLKKALNK
ncbi:HEAT repeat domain-containing protein [Prosthecobacter sp. SYSU 5D2]|uniref:HEAT repeat domain-containing protein n=1 Tax=Prosthecobacter sp. SYSU 5D2 TaxID=3134134 RepID=UPI0031FEC7D6